MRKIFDKNKGFTFFDKNKGFTFVELIIAVSLILGLTVLAIPSILNYQQKQAESEDVKNFISTFRTTQNLALTEDRTYIISVLSEAVKICPALSENCKETQNSFVTSTGINDIRIDRFGNLVDSTGSVIPGDSNGEVVFSTPSYLIKINKYGRIYYNEIN